MLSIIAVLATTKVPNLKANHNSVRDNRSNAHAVLATTKVPNLKANHNIAKLILILSGAVLATTKVPNLNANHNGNTIHLRLLSQGAHL